MTERTYNTGVTSERKTGPRFAERHPDWPPVRVKFFFSPHGIAEDAPDLQHRFGAADVYLYENSRSDVTATFQSIADQDPSVPPVEHIVENGIIYGKPLKGSFWEPVIRGLDASGVKVGGLDQGPEEQVIVDELFRILDTPIQTRATFDEQLEAEKDFAGQFAQLQNQRDKIMAARFEENLEAMVSADPSLKDKPEIKVLISLGGYHTGVYHALYRDGVDVEREFTTEQFTYPYGDHLQRTLAFGREPSRDLLAKSYAETIFTHAVSYRKEDPDLEYKLVDRNFYIRTVASAFSTEEIEAIHTEIKEDRLTTDTLEAMSQAKGIGTIPRNKEELDAFVAKQHAPDAPVQPDIDMPETSLEASTPGMPAEGTVDAEVVDRYGLGDANPPALDADEIVLERYGLGDVEPTTQQSPSLVPHEIDE